MYKILKNIIEMDDYSVQKLSKSQPPVPFQWNTVEGTELNVDDCVGGKGKIGVKANTEQEQLSGKNLLNFSKWTSKEVNGVRWTNNGDGTVTANGTATDNSDFYVIKDYSTKYTGDYTISGCPSGGSATTYYVLQDIGNKSDFGNGVTKSFNNESFAVRLRIMKGYTANGILFRPMIELGITKTEFEPYCGGQPSPNPDYPQEIKVVTGNNLIKHVGKNEFYGEDLGLWYNSSSNIFNTLSGFKSLVCKVKPNTQYTISKKNASNRFVLITSEDKPRGSLPFTRLLIADNNRTNYTFTTLSNENYIFFGVYSGTNTEEIAQAIEEIQLEEGQNATTYEPYRKEEYKLDLWKENEFDINDVNKLNAYIDSSNKITSSEATRTLYVECKKNTLYKISKAKSARFRAMYTTDIPAINRVGNGYIVNDAGEEIIIKTGNNAKYLCVFYYHANQDTLTEQEILESIQIQEAIELCKIGNYEDIPFKNEVGDENYNAELDDGAWYKKKTIDKKVLDDLWTWFNNATNRFSVEITAPDGDYILVALCNKFINASNWTAHTNTDKSFIVRNGDWGQNKCRISFLDSDYASLAEWTQFVSKNNLIVYHRLLNPTYEKITDPTLISQLEALRKAKWFKGVNHCWTETDNLEPNLKGTYRQAINE